MKHAYENMPIPRQTRLARTGAGVLMVVTAGLGVFGYLEVKDTVAHIQTFESDSTFDSSKLLDVDETNTPPTDIVETDADGVEAHARLTAGALIGGAITASGAYGLVMYGRRQQLDALSERQMEPRATQSPEQL